MYGVPPDHTHTGAYAFASGMGALAAVTRLVSSGERIVTGDDIYGGTSRLLAEIVPRQGIEVVNVDCCDLAAVKAAITPNTKLVRLVSLSFSPLAAYLTCALTCASGWGCET